MKLASPIATALLAALALTAQNSQPPRYAITDLGTLPHGTYSYSSIIANNGLVEGRAATTSGAWHAVFWKKSLMTDITQFATPELRGLNSTSWGINDRGQIVGEAESSTPDPNGEDFCGFTPLGLPNLGHTCLPFLFADGVMSSLPTLGGPNGAANQINNQGQIAGLAETTRKDPNCPLPQIFQFKPVLWDRGQVQELPTVGGDLDGIALGLNESGMVTGGTGFCIQFVPTAQVYLQPIHAVMWQNGKATDLGNLGGTGTFGGHQAGGSNNLGQIVGNSDLPGDTTTHAFLWQNGKMTDIGTLPGDAASFALEINDQGSIVGLDLDQDFNIRAVLWQKGVPYDLNSLVAGTSSLYLQLAEGINASGQIVGFGQTAAGDTHAFLATPVHSLNAATEPGVQRPLALTDSARKLLAHRFRFSGLGARIARGK